MEDIILLGEEEKGEAVGETTSNTFQQSSNMLFPFNCENKCFNPKKIETILDFLFKRVYDTIHH